MAEPITREQTAEVIGAMAPPVYDEKATVAKKKADGPKPKPLGLGAAEFLTGAQTVIGEVAVDHVVPDVGELTVAVWRADRRCGRRQAEGPPSRSGEPHVFPIGAPTSRFPLSLLL